MPFVWYCLIHVTLGIIGWKVFTFSNIGVLAAIAVGAGVQAWPMYEIYRVTWDRFAGTLAGTGDAEARRKETWGYWSRMGRLYIFRISAFSLLTLFVAWLMRA